MDSEPIAAEAFAVLGTGRQVQPFSVRYPGFGLADAYRVTAAVRMRREARGERAVGRKIGFTNRAVWTHAPMWGHLYDRTVRDLATCGSGFSLAGFAQPRIEPEIVFGLAAVPEPGMDEAALLGCVEWVAHGFEIVQSIFPDWRFAAADTVAGYGLHAALLIGSRHAVGPRIEGWRRELAGFEVDLLCDGQPVDHGHAVNVLDGPVLALRHLVGLLASDRVNLPLAAGEIITTGTLTRVLPVAAGQTWATKLSGIPLEGARVRFG